MKRALQLPGLAVLSIALWVSLCACDNGGGPFPDDTTTITVNSVTIGMGYHGAEAWLYLFTTREAVLEGNPDAYVAFGHFDELGNQRSFIMRNRATDPILIQGPHYIRLVLGPNLPSFGGGVKISKGAIVVARTTIIDFSEDLEFL